MIVVFLINKLFFFLFGFKLLYELMLGKKFDYLSLKIFGFLCYVSTNLKDRNKFFLRVKFCVYLGYFFGYKGFKVLDLEFYFVLIFRNGFFYESDFFFT